MRRAQVHGPLDEGAQGQRLVAVLRVDQRGFHLRRLPLRQHLHQLARFQIRQRQHAADLEQAQSLQAHRQVRLGVVDRERGGQLDLDFLAVDEEAQLHRARGARRNVFGGDVSVELLQAGRHAVALQIARRGGRQEMEVGQAPAHHIGIDQRADADGAIDAVLDDVDAAVAHAYRQFDVGIAGVEIVERRHQYQLADRAGSFDAQLAARDDLGGRKGAFDFVDLRQHPHAALVVAGAVGGQVQAPRGPLQQAHLEVGFEVLYDVRHRRARQVQGVRGLGETIRVYHADEHFHRLQSIHLRSASLLSVAPYFTLRGGTRSARPSRLAPARRSSRRTGARGGECCDAAGTGYASPSTPPHRLQFARLHRLDGAHHGQLGDAQPGAAGRVIRDAAVDRDHGARRYVDSLPGFGVVILERDRHAGRARLVVDQRTRLWVEWDCRTISAARWRRSCRPNSAASTATAWKRLVTCCCAAGPPRECRAGPVKAGSGLRRVPALLRGSARGITAVQQIRLAVDVARLVAAEEQHQVGDVLRRGGALGRHGGDEAGFGLLIAADDAVQHRRVDRTWRSVVDAHAGSCHFQRGRLGQAVDGMLAGYVQRGARQADLAGDRRDVDDAAAALRNHYRQLIFQAEEDAQHVGVEDGVVVLDGLAGDRAADAFVAGVVDGDVEAAVAGHGRFNQFAHVVFLADVGQHEVGFGTELAQFGLQFGAGLGAAARDDQLGALPGVGQGGGAADAGQCAGDQYNWCSHDGAPKKVYVGQVPAPGRSGALPENGVLKKLRGLGLFCVGREVVVAAFVAAPEGVALVVVQGQVVLQTRRQVRVRREVAAEGDQVGIATGDDVLRRFAGEAAGGDDGALEELAQRGGGDVVLAFVQRVVALDARLDDVQVSQADRVELAGQVAEGGIRIAVGDIAPLAARRDAHADALGAPDRRQRVDQLQHEAGAVLDRAAVGVAALVAAVLQELIGQVTVGAVQLDTVEAGLQRHLGGVAEVFDDGGDFVDGQLAVRRDRHEAFVGQRHALEFRHHRWRHRVGAAGHEDVRLAAAVEQLHEDAAALGVHRLGDFFPAGDLLFGVDGRCAQVGAATLRHGRAFGDQQAALRGALAVVDGHHVGRGVARLHGAQAGQRCQHDAVRQFIRTYFDGRIKTMFHDVHLRVGLMSKPM